MQLGQGVAGVLKRRHALPKHLALLDVVQRPVNGSLGGGHGGDGDLQALPGQLLHQADKAAPFHGGAAQQILGGHLHVVEEQLGRVLRLHAHLLEALAFFKAGHAALDQ